MWQILWLKSIRIQHIHTHTYIIHYFKKKYLKLNERTFIHIIHIYRKLQTFDWHFKFFSLKKKTTTQNKMNKRQFSWKEKQYIYTQIYINLNYKIKSKRKENAKTKIIQVLSRKIKKSKNRKKSIYKKIYK